MTSTPDAESQPEAVDAAAEVEADAAEVAVVEVEVIEVEVIEIAAVEVDVVEGDAGADELEPADAAPAASIDETAARGLALAALREITPDSTIGDPSSATVSGDGVLTLRYENRMPGYPGWFWTVALAQVADAEPTVLEVELLPGEGALTAPEWTPWAERLAEYHAAQAALAAEGLATDEDADDDVDDDDEDDVDDLDAADFDEDASPILHSGDVDGVDIDELADIDPDADSGDVDDDDADDDDADNDADDDDADDDDADDSAL